MYPRGFPAHTCVSQPLVGTRNGSRLPGRVRPPCCPYLLKTSGFLSKDAILAGTLSFTIHHPQHFLLAICGFGAAFLTAFYMFRLMFLTFFGKPANKEVYNNLHESPKTMTVPLSFFIFFTLPNINPFSDYGWFTSLIKAKDSLVPGSLNLTSLEIAEGMHHSHSLAMILSILIALT